MPCDALHGLEDDCPSKCCELAVDCPLHEGVGLERVWRDSPSELMDRDTGTLTGCKLSAPVGEIRREPFAQRSRSDGLQSSLGKGSCPL